MAVDTAPLLPRRRNVAFKVETTTGTPISLGATNGTTPIFTDGDVQIITPDIEQIEREGQGSLSPIAMQFGARAANIKFQHELYNSGSGTPPAWTDLLEAGGMTAGSGGVYTPVTGETTTLTVGHYLPGRALFAAGAMFSWTLNAERGKPARMHWTGRGVWHPPTSGTLSTPTYDAVIAPRVGATTFTIGGNTYRVPAIEIEFGNTIILREDITALDSNSEATGYRAAFITDRQTRIRVSPESLALSTKDWYSVHRGSTTAALSLVIGSGSNNVITFACAKLQLVNPPTVGDRSGMMTDTLEFRPVRNTDAGDDDLQITLS